ncbi:MAG: SGNH/GDSL hydrolase family protein [Candidatus Binataceae bacterium]
MATLEIGLRLLGPGQTGLYTFDPNTGWTLLPNASRLQDQEGRAFVQVSSAGLRDREHSYRKPPNTFRIAVLGDSFTEAKHVTLDHTFCAVIERRLAACPALAGKTVETLNFGCDSYGTAQELMTLRHRVWQFSPDMVVIAFCTGNDIRNDSIELERNKCQPFFTYRAGELVLSGPFEESPWFRFQCMMRYESRHSAALNALGQLHSDIRASLRARRQLAQLPPNAGFEPGLDDWIYKPPANAVQREAWNVAEGELELVHQETAAHGARLLVVTLSNGVQVNPDPMVRSAYMRQTGLDNLFYPDFRIKALGERRGFAVLNLAPPFQAYAESHHVFLHGFSNTRMGSGHWNENGHRYAGELIARRLCELLERPAPPPAARQTAPSTP